MGQGTSVDRLFFELGIDPSGMRRGATQAQGMFSSLSKRAKITLGVLGGFTAVFAAIGVKSVAAASKFQDAFNEVRTLIDETQTDSEFLRKEVLKLAAVVGRPPDEVSRGLYQVISAGVTDAAKAMDVLEVATRASIGGLTDQFTAVDAVTTVLNAYNLEASEAENVTDLMLNAVKEGKLTFSDLAANIGIVVSSAAQAGIGFDEVSAALATMTKAGLSTELSVTALNNLILRIVNPQDEAARAAKSMGVEFGAAALKANGLTGIMTQMSIAADGSLDKFIEMLPELRGMRAGSILAGTGFTEFTRIMETTQNVAGTTTEFFVKIKESMSETAKEISARLNVAFIKLGNKILPSVTRTMEGLLDLLDRFTKTDIERQVDALEKISGTEALVRRLQLTERIELERKKGIQTSEKLLEIQEGGVSALVRLGIIEFKNRGLVDLRVQDEGKLIRAIVDRSKTQEGMNDLLKTEQVIRQSLNTIEIALGEARAAGNKEEMTRLNNSKDEQRQQLNAVTQILLLMAQQIEGREIISAAEAEILDLLKMQGVVKKNDAKTDKTAEKSITKQQDELKDKIQIIEQGAASEIALIRLTGKVEKTEAGLIRAQVAEIRNATIDRLQSHLKSAEKVYGAESLFVKDLKIAIAELMIQAGQEIQVTLKTDLVLGGIDRSSRAVAGLSRELLGLSDSGELTIRRVGDLAAGLIDLRKAFRNTESGLLDKFIPALGLIGTGVSVLKGIFGKTERTTSDLVDTTRRLEEAQRRLNDVMAAQVDLGDLSEQERLQRKIAELGTFEDIFGLDISEEALRRFAAGETITEIFGRTMSQQQAAIAQLLSSIGREGVQAFLDMQAVIEAALADGFISAAEARAIDDAIANFQQFTNALSNMSEEALNTLLEIERLTDSLRKLADAAKDAAGEEKITLEDKPDVSLEGRDISGLLGFELLEDVEELIDDILNKDKDRIIDAAAGGGSTQETRDFRFFVGITELQGNILLGILNTSLDVQRQQLDFFKNSFVGIGGLENLTIGEFNFEVNFDNVNLSSDQDIQGVSEALAEEVVDALRAVGGS